MIIVIIAYSSISLHTHLKKTQFLIHMLLNLLLLDELIIISMLVIGNVKKVKKVGLVYFYKI